MKASTVNSSQMHQSLEGYGTIDGTTSSMAGSAPVQA